MKVLIIAATLAALASCTLPAPAQTKIFTNRTVAGGNPFNDVAPSTSYNIGQNNSNALVDNLLVDIVAPASISTVQILRNSQVSIQGGTLTSLFARDTSVTTMSGGTIGDLTIGIQPTTPGGVVAPSFSITGGSVGAGVNDSAAFRVSAGVLDVSGGSLGGGFVGGDVGSASIMVRSGTFTTNTFADALQVRSQGQAQISGGVFTGVVRVGDAGQVVMTGGTINGGIRGAFATANGSGGTGVGVISGGTVNGGVVIGLGTTNRIDVRGGTFTPYTNSGTTASFINIGLANLAFYGTGLTLSNATAGNLVFNTGGDVTFAGNYYTFTAGQFENGQSAVGYRLFDAVSQGNSTAPYSGGFTLVNTAAAAPEPSAFALLILPTFGAIIARRRKNH